MTKRLHAQIKPNSKHREGVERLDDTFLIYVKAPAKDGKANQRVIELLAKHFQTSKSRVKLISGHASRYKTFEIE